MSPPFKLTYSTMFDPPPELHARFDAAVAALRQHLGAEHALAIGGRDERAAQQFEVRSPIDTRVVIGRFQAGDAVARRRRGRGGEARIPRLGGDAVGGSRRACCGGPLR